MAIVESMADKDPLAAELYATFDKWIKSFGNFVATSVVTPTAVVGLASVALPIHKAGFGWPVAWSLFLAATVWLLATIRQSIVAALRELDENDDIGLRKLISWAEDGWVGGGMIFLVLLPVLTLIVAGLTVVGMIIVQRIIRAREEKQKTPCPSCGHPSSPSSLQCAQCEYVNPAPLRLGMLGAKSVVATDLDLHRLELLGRRRCIHCAERLPERRLSQTCPACNRQVLPSRAWAESYIAFLDRKLWPTASVCFGLSLIPILGLIPGIIYYRLSLISSLRTYIPRSTGCMMRIGVRMLNIVLLAVQWIPGVGGFVLPAMCYINYWIYRKALVERMQLEFQPQVTLPPLPPPLPQA
ncbi:MAG: hypothetical protein AAGD38_00520 [Acidobacteriota bacterium]